MTLSIFRVTAAAVLALGLGMSPHTNPKTPQLGGNQRYLTAISTDKPIYHPGDRVYARGVLLGAFHRTPFPGQAQAQLELKGPRGEMVAAGTTYTQDGVWAFSWEVPEEASGGEYLLTVSYPSQGDPPAERKFDVRDFRAPRLKSQITFAREGYGPGDKVSATLKTERAEGGIPEGAKVVATARVDGAEVARVEGKVDAKGRCTVSFELPKQLEKGDGALAFAIEDGGVVETAAKTLPILMQTVDLAFYPEGGDLVGGLTSRVYFEGKTPAGKPADISGTVVDVASGETVAHFRSEHEGRGRFELTPKAGAKYALRISQPAGIKRSFPLPKVREDGAIVRSLQDVYGPGDAIRLAVSAKGEGPFQVVLSHREMELGSEATAGNDSTVTLDPQGDSGVLVATVFDGRGRPLAERLVYRRPAQALKVELRAEKKSYAPGAPVKLVARTTENGEPVSAVVGITVSDDSVLQILEKREQPPSLPVMVFLEPEVKELADAQVYLDPKNPKAPLATDLLLGTQGWRRFAFVNPSQFVAEKGDPALRVVAMRQPVQAQFEDDGFAEEGVAGGVLGGAMHGGPRGQGAGMGRMMEKPAPAKPMARMPGRAMAPMPAMEPMAAPPMAPAPMAAAPMAQPRPMGPAPMQRQAVAQNRPMNNFGRFADKKKLERRDFDRRRLAAPVSYVREYAHLARADRKASDRVDFTETLYWNAGVRTDARTGEAAVSFAMSDAVTSFRATAGAFTQNGVLGAGEAVLNSVQPFYLEPKLPLEVTAGDLVRLPIALVNATEATLRGTQLQIHTAAPLTASAIPAIDLRPGQRARSLVDLKVGQGNREVPVVLEAVAGDFGDKVERTLQVRPAGFPVERAFGGLVSAQAPASHELVIPDRVVEGSMAATASVFPTPLANMTSALERLIQEPNGCFEQTSSTTYPLTMAQQYFTTHTGVDPAVIERSRETLDRGYQRLVGFECKEKGYEWFGQDPGHEALTAYGLMLFTDMSQFREVDQAMLATTKQWMLKQRDGQGGFERKRRALHTWIEDKDTSNAYILWALLETGERDLSKEIAAAKAAAEKTPNTYVAALTANSMFLAGDKGAGDKLLEKLASHQAKDGRVEGATQSIVGSTGESLSVETTSLAALAWMRSPKFAPNVELAIKYLADNCKSGRYGSTQSTVLALRAIVAYDKERARPKGDGSVQILVDGKPAGAPVKFDAQTQGAIALPDFAQTLTSGSHKISLQMQGGGQMPYAITVKYNALTPESSPATKVGIEVALANRNVTEGELVEANAIVLNRTKEKLPTVVAIIGLPGGLEARHDQLKELVKKGTIDAYEVRGREVILYWRGMQPESRIRVPLSLVAAVPGTYTGPASRAYLYYGDEDKTWVSGLAVQVAPKAG